jgi:hypothetical protein
LEAVRLASAWVENARSSGHKVRWSALVLGRILSDFAHRHHSLAIRRLIIEHLDSIDHRLMGVDRGRGVLARIKEYG